MLRVFGKEVNMKRSISLILIGAILFGALNGCSEQKPAQEQEEAQMTHCPTSSKVKAQQCVWPLGLDVIAALAHFAAKIKAVGQQPRRSLGIQPMARSPCPLPHTSLPRKFLKQPV